MATTAAFTVKGDLHDGNLLADSVWHHMRIVYARMDQYRDDHPDGFKGDMPEEYKGDYQLIGELDRLFFELTGSHPKFPPKTG